MADQQARIHTQPSNRARPKDAKEKKAVFKGVLDSPLRIQWPSVPLNLQNSILASIIQLLDGASNYFDQRSSLNRKRKRASKISEVSPPQEKRRKIAVDETMVPVDSESNATPQTATNPDLDLCETVDDVSLTKKVPEPPLLLHHLVYGINAVTKVLEIQVQNAHRPVIFSVQEQASKNLTRLKYVFVCRADVDPPLLIDHLPHLVAAFNSNCPSKPIKIVPLPKGSESTLAQTLGIRRAAVLAISTNYPEQDGLLPLLDRIPVLSAQWLSRADPSRSLFATHVKQLRTTAPKDMKVSKELRNQGRERAKLKNREHLLK
ncbi:unnamed protein product [Cyclocybe aegerita]|uniref:Uncharacterized protein n=1 Tax=Cyclocybe aegerita TaxID=1973307 RepID=A0A8S0XM39_CYCAE|nr:unnamed protein product [Cyclocybe aegerita]